MSKYALINQVDTMSVRNSRDLNANMIRIVEAYTVDLVPVIEIAMYFKVSRQAVYKALRRAGIDTTKKGGILVSCSACGQEIKRHRCQVRQAKHVFCDQTCYFVWLEAGQGKGPYIQNRHGMRLARAEVSRWIVLQPGWVVHHDDRNTLNNDPHNLKVFRNDGDHVRYHRDFQVEPIWDGALLPLNPKYPNKPKKID